MTGDGSDVPEDAGEVQGPVSGGYRPGLWRALFAAVVLLGVGVTVLGALTDVASGG